MFDQPDNKDPTQLAEVNAELRASLKRCRVLLDECRSKLAANSNEPQTADQDEREDAQSTDRG